MFIVVSLVIIDRQSNTFQLWYSSAPKCWNTYTADDVYTHLTPRSIFFNQRYFGREQRVNENVISALMWQRSCHLNTKKRFQYSPTQLKWCMSLNCTNTVGVQVGFQCVHVCTKRIESYHNPDWKSRIYLDRY